MFPLETHLCVRALRKHAPLTCQKRFSVIHPSKRFAPCHAYMLDLEINKDQL